MRRAAVAAATTVLAFAFAPAGTGAAQPPLALGFFDNVYLAPEHDLWMQRSGDAGADIVRIDTGWVAPDTRVRPAGLDARDPADPAYDFTRVDDAVRSADAHGLRVLLSTGGASGGAPRWAEGPNRDPAARAGSWLPDPGALADYAVALARRYSGAFGDPARPGQMLPRVDAFQVWNEPNLDTYLAPQWRGRRSVAPAHYRRMLNAYYRAVKAVRPEVLVVTGGTAPFGDPHPGGSRTSPARFVRELLCVRQDLRRASCSQAARFDVLSHHPYSVGAPRRRARNRDDVSIPDLGKLTRLLRAAERTGGALPRKRHRLWVTEVSYDSNGPDPDGVPLALHARYLQEALYLLWRQGVDMITWFQIRDQPPQPSFAASSQSGIHFLDGRPKPAWRAFRFPFVVATADARRQRAWGRAPVAGALVIERRAASGWTRVKTLQVGAREVFQTLIPRTGRTSVRGRVGSETSLVWRGR